jgi:SAM-dependent methyltransferase
MTAHYDDPTFSYDQYWLGRDYEHQSELIAIGRLLKSRHFQNAADIGGGYGRLTAFLTPFAKKSILIEPSLKQRQIAKNFLKGFKNISIDSGTTQHTKLSDASMDLVLVVRVMHHLPDPNSSLHEFNRILKPGGILVLEFANSLHFKARIASFFSGQPILPTPLDKRSNSSIRHHSIAFVNHYPNTVFKLLDRSGFVIDQYLSVSNLRSPFLKKYVPMKILLTLENFLQNSLAHIFFGPSIFVLAHKPKP